MPSTRRGLFFLHVQEWDEKPSVGASGAAVANVDLQTAAGLAGELVKRRPKPGRPENDAGQSFAVQSVASFARIDPGRAAQLKRPGCAAPLG